MSIYIFSLSWFQSFSIFLLRYIQVHSYFLHFNPFEYFEYLFFISSFHFFPFLIGHSVQAAPSGDLPDDVGKAGPLGL